MEKSKAIELLKQALADIPRLRGLPYDNQAFRLWLAKVETIMKEGLEDDDYERLDSVQSKYFPDELEIDNLLLEENYLPKLNDYEVALKSIIQKYELLGLSEKSIEKTDRQRAIELLMQKSKEAVYVASLPYNNNEYLPWRRNIEDILEATFGVTSTEYKRVADSRVTIMATGTHKSIQEGYKAAVHRIQQEVDSIIQKYERLDIGTEQSIIEVSPESIFREVSPKVFISHGKESVALRKLKDFIETLGIEPLIVKRQASLDKDLPDKVNLYLNQADFVIILATGDDRVKDKKTGKEIIQPRQNIIHEIGLAQNTHPGMIIYLLEEGAEFPSNIRPRVWENFKQRNMMDAFFGIVRELRAYGILKVIKYPIKEHPKAI